MGVQLRFSCWRVRRLASRMGMKVTTMTMSATTLVTGRSRGRVSWLKIQIGSVSCCPAVKVVTMTSSNDSAKASMPPASVAAVLAAQEVMETEPEWVERLWDNAYYMLDGFKRLGYDTGPSQTPIIPIIIGDEFRTVGLWMGLFEEGIYTNPVLSPGVAPGTERLRTSYMATHTDEQLDRVLGIFEKVGKEIGLI